MSGCQEPRDVLKYRYHGNFKDFDNGIPPEIIYAGYGQDGKDTARGLEQKRFEKLGGLGNTANKQNPVGPNNKRKDKYKKAANKKCKCGLTASKPGC